MKQLLCLSLLFVAFTGSGQKIYVGDTLDLTNYKLRYIGLKIGGDKLVSLGRQVYAMVDMGQVRPNSGRYELPYLTNGKTRLSFFSEIAVLNSMDHCGFDFVMYRATGETTELMIFRKRD